MLIEPFTVVAQVVNFLVLVLLLRLFLYKPITRAMQKRREKIAERLEEGERKREEAEAEAERYREERRDLEESRASLLDEAKEEAAERRRQLLSEAREEVEAARERWRSSLEQQRESFIYDLRQHIATHIYEIARKALADLADADLESRMAERFVERLDTMEPDELERLVAAIEGSDGVVRVRSRFELGRELREMIAESLEEHVGFETELRFETAEDLIAGIELQTDGLKVAWSLDEYLGTLAESLQQELAEEAHEGARGADQRPTEDEPAEVEEAVAEAEDDDIPAATVANEETAEGETSDGNEAGTNDDGTETEETSDDRASSDAKSTGRGKS